MQAGSGDQMLSIVRDVEAAINSSKQEVGSTGESTRSLDLVILEALAAEPFDSHAVLEGLINGAHID